jgi:hypothetical protein
LNRSARNSREKLSQRRNALARSLEPQSLQLGERALPNSAARLHQPVQRSVVKHDGLAVRRQLNVEFDGEAARDRRLGGAKRVLDHARRRVVQPAVRDRSRR